MGKSLLTILLLGLFAFGQSKPSTQSKTTATHRAAPSSSKPAIPYLAAPLDLTTSDLGPDFRGNDISAIYKAISNSPTLKSKSEFETTAQFEARRQSFADQPILGTLTPGSTFVFVIPNDSPVYGSQFKYDADSQTLTFTLEGRSMTFYLEAEHPELDTILIRSTELDSGTYMASNAFGATVKVDKTYSRDNGVALTKDNWLFKSSERYPRKFTHLFTMTPDQARIVKDSGNVLLVCKLVAPWFRETVHGHEAKIDEPYEITVSDNYLQAVPLQLWIFNRRTGDVLTKISEMSVAEAQNEQLASS